MRALLFIIFSLFFTISFAAVLILNTYDNSGYIVSQNYFSRFAFQGSCSVYEDEMNFVYTPPDADINKLLSFPCGEIAVTKSGLTFSSTGTDITIPPDVFKLFKDKKIEKIFCINLPITLKSATQLHLKEDVTLFQLGSNLFLPLKAAGVKFEFPMKHLFKRGELLYLTPSPPTIDLFFIELDGLGSFVSLDVRDFSAVKTSVEVDGKELNLNGYSFLLPPGTHTVTVTATDIFGLWSSANKKVFSKDFEVHRHFEKIEIGYPVNEKILKKLPVADLIKDPGVYEFKVMKPNMLSVYTIEATDSLAPIVTYSFDNGKVSFDATDVNGVATAVFVNGEVTNILSPGTNTVVLVAVDRYGNSFVKSFSIVRKIDAIMFTKKFNLGSLFFSGFVKKIGGGADGQE